MNGPITQPVFLQHHCTALHCHNIVHESSQQCSAWRPAHLLALIPLSRDLNEEGVAFIGGLRAPEMPYSHFWNWGKVQHFTWFWLLSHFQVASLREANAHSLSAPPLSYYRLSSNVQNFHLVEISLQQVVQSSTVHCCKKVSPVSELEIAECGSKPGHISRQIIITQFLLFLVGDRQCSFLSGTKLAHP